MTNQKTSFDQSLYSREEKEKKKTTNSVNISKFQPILLGEKRKIQNHN